MRRQALVGRDLPAIGSGDVSLALSASRGVDRREVERALHATLTAGLLLIEIAAETDAERLVGEAIRSLRLRDASVVATKVPAIAERAGVATRDVLPERLPVGYLQEQIEGTLRALRLDAIPLAQLPVRPRWRSSSAWPEVVGTCERLQREGKVLAWGAIVDDADAADEELLPLTAEPWLVALQLTYSICARAGEPLMAAALERKLTVLARRPLAGSALAGNLGPGVRLTPRDDRNTLDTPALEKVAVEAARLAPLVRTEPPAPRSCDAARAVRERGRRPDHVEADTLGELALRFVLDRGAVPLPRLHRAEHVLPAFVAVMAPSLSAALIARIRDERPAAPPAELSSKAKNSKTAKSTTPR